MAKLKLPRQRRQYHSIYGLDGGLHTNMGSTMIGEKETPNCANVVFRESMVSKANGSEYFASTDSTPLNGSVIRMNQSYQTGGLDKLICHTLSNTYAYNATSAFFECITLGEVVEDCEDDWAVNANVTVTTTTDLRKGSKSVKLTIDADFTTGVAAYEDFTSDDFSAQTYLHFFIKSDIATDADDLQLILGDTTAGGTPVGGSDSGRFVVPALEAGVWKDVSIEMTTPGDLTTVESVALYVKVDNGAQVVEIDDVMVTTEMTGDGSNNIASVLMNDNYIFASLVQTVRYWNLSSATTTALPGCDNYKAKAMIKFGERLCLYHMVETSTVYAQRIRWTAAGTPASTPNATDWTAVGSGYTDLYAALGSDFIQTAEKIGNYVAIYAERTIVLQEYQNKVGKPFIFHTRVTGKGLAAPDAIVNLDGEEHIFLGWNGIYIYKGGRDVEEIGVGIRDELFASINPEYIHRSFMVHIEEKQEVRLYFPKAGSTTPDEYYLYNLETRKWSRGFRGYTASGHYETNTTVTWDSATGTWDEQTAKWNDSSLLALAPLTLYGDSSGYVYRDSAVKNLAGSLIDGYWDTKDFVTGDGYRRTMTNWMEMNFEARGDRVDVYYSIDLGASWSEAKTFTLTDAWLKYNFDFEVNAPQIRFRFRNNTSASTFDVRWNEYGFVAASDRGVA